MLHISWDSPLVQHLPTSWWSFSSTYMEAGISGAQNQDLSCHHCLTVWDGADALPTELCWFGFCWYIFVHRHFLSIDTNLQVLSFNYVGRSVKESILKPKCTVQEKLVKSLPTTKVQNLIKRFSACQNLLEQKQPSNNMPWNLISYLATSGLHEPWEGSRVGFHLSPVNNWHPV